MKKNFNEISKNLNTKGFFIIKNFINGSDIDSKFLNHVKKKEKFVDGVVHGLEDKYYTSINTKIKEIAKNLNNKDLNISDKKFSYASIRIKKNIKPKAKLIKPFNIFKDPKVLPGGGLNWHIDHYTYFFHNDHKNYLICYMPILKSSPLYSNVAIVPYDILKKNAYHVFALIFTSLKYRDKYIAFMKKNNIECFFHYYPLHMSKFGKNFKCHNLSVSEKIYNGLVRLPLYPLLSVRELNRIILTSKKFLKLI